MFCLLHIITNTQIHKEPKSTAPHVTDLTAISLLRIVTCLVAMTT
jgi:hypothetical protein